MSAWDKLYKTIFHIALIPGNLLDERLGNMAAILEIWPTSWKYGHHLGNMATILEIWPPSWKSGRHLGNLATILEIWPPVLTQGDSRVPTIFKMIPKMCSIRMLNCMLEL